MSQIWRGVSGGIEVLENVNEMADLPDISTIDSEGVWYIESGEFGPDYIAPTNWDSSAGEFTDWFSLFDGRILVDIPDPDVYLQDDWGDNKLQDRDDSGTTTYNGVEGVYRPEYDIPTELEKPTAQNEQLEISADEGVVCPININLDEKLRCEFEIDLSDAGGSGDVNRNTWFTVFAETNEIASDPKRILKSYTVSIPGDTVVTLERIDEDGSTVDLVDGSEDTNDGENTVVVERSENSEWELILNDSSQGTATDDTYKNPEYSGITAHDGEVGTHKYDNYKSN